MIELVAKSILYLALGLTAVAAAWLVIEILFATPNLLVFAEIAIICAVLSPILCLLGWGLRWIGWRAQT